MKIYIYGKNRGVYRTKILINKLLDMKDVEISFIGFEEEFNKKWLNYLERIFLFFVSLFLTVRCDVILIPAMQHDTAIIKVAKVLNKKIIVDYYISYFDTFVYDRKVVNKKSLKAKKLYRRDRNALLYADKCIFLNNAEKEYYCKVVDVESKKVNSIIVPLVINEKKYAQLNYFKRKTQIMNLCWTGSYIPLQGLDKLIEMMRYVKKNNLNCHLYIWGDKEEKATLYRELIKENELEKYITIHNEWGDVEKWEKFIIENCDVSMGIFGDSCKAKTVCANKVVDGVAFRTPVITAYSKGAEEFFKDNEGVYFTRNTPKDIYDVVNKLYLSKIEDISPGLQKSQEIYKRVFSEKAFKNNLNKIIFCENEKIIDSKGGE